MAPTAILNPKILPVSAPSSPEITTSSSDHAEPIPDTPSPNLKPEVPTESVVPVAEAPVVIATDAQAALKHVEVDLEDELASHEVTKQQLRQERERSREAIATAVGRAESRHQRALHHQQLTHRREIDELLLNHEQEIAVICATQGHSIVSTLSAERQQMAVRHATATSATTHGAEILLYKQVADHQARVRDGLLALAMEQEEARMLHILAISTPLPPDGGLLLHRTRRYMAGLIRLVGVGLIVLGMWYLLFARGPMQSSAPHASALSSSLSLADVRPSPATMVSVVVPRRATLVLPPELQPVSACSGPGGPKRYACSSAPAPPSTAAPKPPSHAILLPLLNRVGARVVAVHARVQEVVLNLLAGGLRLAAEAISSALLVALGQALLP